jgi:mannose-6-phosphate isomerase-like protein (cupin superfamily)
MEVQIISPDENNEFETPELCRILESWNDESDPSVSIARATVKPGITTQPHLLEGVVERYLVISGNGNVQIGDLPPQEVRPGDVVVIPACISQQVTNTGSDDLVFYCICTPRFTPECYRSLTGSLGAAVRGRTPVRGRTTVSDSTD